MAYRGDEDYVEVEGVFKGATDKAVKIDVGGEEAWVARSTLAWSCDQQVTNMKKGDSYTFKMMEWVAEKNGFI